MDILYHAASGIAIAKSMHAPEFGGAALSAMLPDILGIIPFYAIKFMEASPAPKTTFIKKYTRLLLSNKFANTFDAAVYRTTHSLYAAGAFAIIMYIFFREQWVLYSASYLSHILIDIPTHQGDFATRIFYPSSDFHFRGSNWSTHPKRFLSFWLTLVLIMLLLWQK